MFINSLDKLLSQFVTQAALEETGTVRQFLGKRQQNRLCVRPVSLSFLFRKMTGVEGLQDGTRKFADV